MGTLLHLALDGERRAECQAADAADALADQRRCDLAIRRAREAARHASPFWMFGARRPEQERITHPLAAAPDEQRPRPFDPHRFGGKQS